MPKLSWKQTPFCKFVGENDFFIFYFSWYYWIYLFLFINLFHIFYFNCNSIVGLERRKGCDFQYLTWFVKQTLTSVITNNTKTLYLYNGSFIKILLHDTEQRARSRNISTFKLLSLMKVFINKQIWTCVISHRNVFKVLQLY